MAIRLGDDAPDFTADSTEGPDQLPRVEGRQLGRALLAPQGLHPGLHHRARPGRRRSSPSSTSATSRSWACRSTAWPTTRSGARTSTDVTGSKLNFPLLGRPGPQGRRPLRHDPPERQRHPHRALGVRDRPGQQGEAHPHLPRVHRPELRRAPPGHRLAAAHRQAQGGHAGRLEERRGRHHRARRRPTRTPRSSTPRAGTRRSPTCGWSSSRADPQGEAERPPPAGVVDAELGEAAVGLLTTRSRRRPPPGPTPPSRRPGG